MTSVAWSSLWYGFWGLLYPSSMASKNLSSVAVVICQSNDSLSFPRVLEITKKRRKKNNKYSSFLLANCLKTSSATSAGSRPWDKGGRGGGHPDPYISGGGGGRRSPKNFFCLKIGGAIPSRPLPWIRHWPRKRTVNKGWTIRDETPYRCSQGPNVFYLPRSQVPLTRGKQKA